MLYAKVESFARSKLFWAIVVVIATSLAILGTHLKISYLGFPFTLLFLSIFSLAGMAVLSVPLAVNYARYHIWYFGKRGLKYDKDSSYLFSFPKVRRMIMRGILSVIGMTYLIVSAVPFIDPNSSPGIAILLMSFLGFLVIAPALNVSTLILRKTALFYENIHDGTRMNLGVDLANKLAWVIGPLALLRLIFLEVTSFPNNGIGFLLLGFTLVVALPSLALGYFLLKDRLPILAEKVDRELEKILRGNKP